MSIINQMLKDLEKREKVALDPDITLVGLISTESAEKIFLKKIKIGSIGLILMLSMIFLIKNISTKSEEKTDGLIMPLSSQSTMTDNSFDGLTFPNTFAPADLSSISLEANNNVTEIRFFLNNTIQYRLATNSNHSELILTLEHTKLVADISPINYLKSNIQGMQMTSNKAGDLIVTFNLLPGTDVNYVDMVAGEKSPELRVRLINNPPAAKNNTNFSVKKTDEFNAKLKYQNALNDINVGKYSAAIPILSSLLVDYPGDYNVREVLIAALLQEGLTSKAYSLLETGLQLKPYYPPFIQIKARILISKNKTIQALNLLERAPPAIQQYPDYYALMAALYRQTGHADKAFKLYKQLVLINPRNATFWAGLGIVLENLGRGQDAKKVYVEATQLGGLDPHLESYLESRIDRLATREA